MLLIQYSTMSVVLCNGDDVKIVQNGFIMRDHCIQLMLRPHSLLLQSHRDQRSLTLPCCLPSILSVAFLQLHQPGFKYCCGLSCLLDWCPTWVSHLAGPRWIITSEHGLSAAIRSPTTNLEHGRKTPSYATMAMLIRPNLLANFFPLFLFLLPLILTSPRIRTMCWTSMGPLPPLMWMTGGAGDWWAEDIQNNIT